MHPIGYHAASAFIHLCAMHAQRIETFHIDVYPIGAIRCISRMYPL